MKGGREETERDERIFAAVPISLWTEWERKGKRGPLLGGAGGGSRVGLLTVEKERTKERQKERRKERAFSFVKFMGKRREPNEEKGLSETGETLLAFKKRRRRRNARLPGEFRWRERKKEGRLVRSTPKWKKKRRKFDFWEMEKGERQVWGTPEWLMATE